MSSDAVTPLGRIPFRIRVGVTGHRAFASEPNLAGLADDIRRLVPSHATTPIRLAVVSALAEGADRLVVEEVFADAAARGEEARLEVVLPFDLDRYSELQEFSPASEAELQGWLDRAASVTELAGASEPAALALAYEAAGKHVVSRCDVLVAIWDGKVSGGRGGTAETLLYAAANGKPCIWLPPDDRQPRRDNLTKSTAAAFRGDVWRRATGGEESPHGVADEPETLLPLEATFRQFDAFNRAPVPPESALRRRIESELGPLEDSSAWVAWPFARAASLADSFEYRFIWGTRALTLLAVAAAVALGVSAAAGHESRIWAWTEVGCLVALVVIFAAIRRARLHSRWLSYRLLAERFRTAYYIASAGIDFRRTVGHETVFVDRRSSDWLLRAFEEVWDSRPPVPDVATLAEDEFVRLRRFLAHDWIDGQIAFHVRAHGEHERLARILDVLIFVCFLGTIAFATVRATELLGKNPTIVFSITLPIAAGALGVLLTVRQHHALAERYARMRADLEAVRRALLDAEPQTIGRVTSEAAQIIAEENGDWFGAMWFLDVEHP